MADRKSVKISEIISKLDLEPIYLPKGGESDIFRADVNRPAFALSGFFDRFEEERIQLIGNAEYAYLESRSDDRYERIEAFLSHSPAAVVFTTSLEVFPEFVTLAKRYSIPLLRTSTTTSEFMAALIAYLQVCLAPRTVMHGVLVELYGEGILILGDSGIGKSETAIELVQRGHRLIADDAVEISRVSSITLVGQAPELIKYYAELRGVGIVDVRRTFGVGAVKDTQKIDMVICLENWNPDKFYDRMGLDKEEMDILGIKVPKLTIPVRPGRNLSIIIEVAAMTSREKHMGYDTASEFFQKTVEQAERLSGLNQ